MDQNKDYPLTSRLVNGVKSFETFRAVPYLDAVGVWTWGYGETQGPHPEKPLLEPEADLMVRASLTQAQHMTIQEWHAEIIFQGQLDCLTDMMFNIGPGRPAKLHTSGRDGIVWLANGSHSTLWAKMVLRDYAAVAVEIPKWNKGGGIVLGGLVRRRAFDLTMWNDDAQPI